MTCEAPDCGRPVYASGLCNAHYIRHRKGLDMGVPVMRRRTTKGTLPCNVPDCSKDSYGYGLCKGHYNQARLIRFKRVLVNRLGGKCMDCGGEFPLAALDFHHRDPAQKDFSVSEVAINRGIEAGFREADKCDLLCANCHRIRHATNADIEKHIDNTNLEHFLARKVKHAVDVG